MRTRETPAAGSVRRPNSRSHVLYPLVDVAAAVIDIRSSHNVVLYANVAISGAAVVGILVAASVDIPAVLQAWGVWAVVAGLIQLIVALRRRAMAGQWPMMLAGGISLLAGAGFVVQSGDATSLKMVAGYAALSALFFLASAIKLAQRSRGRQVDRLR